MGAINKPANLAAIAGVMKGKEVHMPRIPLALAILLEIGGAVVIVMERFLPPAIIHVAVALLVAYSLLAAVMFHNSWRLENPRGTMAWPVSPRTSVFAAAS